MDKKEKNRRRIKEILARMADNLNKNVLMEEKTRNKYRLNILKHKAGRLLERHLDIKDQIYLEERASLSAWGKFKIIFFDLLWAILIVLIIIGFSQYTHLE